MIILHVFRYSLIVKIAAPVACFPGVDPRVDLLILCRFAAQLSGGVEPGPYIGGAPAGGALGLASSSFRGHSVDGCAAAEQLAAASALAGYTLAYSSVGGEFAPGGGAASAALLGTSAPAVGSPRWHLLPPSQQQQQRLPSPTRSSPPATAAAASIPSVMGFHPPPSASSSGSGPALFGAPGAAQYSRPAVEMFRPDIEQYKPGFEQYKPGLDQYKPALSLSGRWRSHSGGGAEAACTAAPAALEASDSVKLNDSLSSFMRLQPQRPVG